jgi:D-alanyl-D-alanine carboxypeptidase
MRKALGACGAVALLFAMIAVAGAQDKTMTWAGWISDSACAAKGMSAAHKDCAVKCVKEKGASWVFVEAKSKKVLAIHNQDAVSEDQLGHEVEVTGHVMEDGSLHIDKIMPKA